MNFKIRRIALFFSPGNLKTPGLPRMNIYVSTQKELMHSSIIKKKAQRAQKLTKPTIAALALKNDVGREI